MDVTNELGKSLVEKVVSFHSNTQKCRVKARVKSYNESKNTYTFETTDFCPEIPQFRGKYKKNLTSSHETGELEIADPNEGLWITSRALSAPEVHPCIACDAHKSTDTANSKP